MAAGFLLSSSTVFGLLNVLGRQLPVRQQNTYVLLVSFASLVALALDVYNYRLGKRWSFGVRRQTPRALWYRRDRRKVALMWGLDTGIVVSTFRVTALSWVALLATFLLRPGASSVFIYGVAFVLPQLVQISNGKPTGGRERRSLVRFLATGYLVVGTLGFFQIQASANEKNTARQVTVSLQANEVLTIGLHPNRHFITVSSTETVQLCPGSLAGGIGTIQNTSWGRLWTRCLAPGDKARTVDIPYSNRHLAVALLSKRPTRVTITYVPKDGFLTCKNSTGDEVVCAP